MFGARRLQKAQQLAKAIPKRVLTEEEQQEEAIKDELADLPDDEGMEEEGAGAQEQEQEQGGPSDLGRRPRRHEPSEDEDLGSEEEDEIENDEVAALKQQLQHAQAQAQQNLGRRPRHRDAEEALEEEEPAVVALKHELQQREQEQQQQRRQRLEEHEAQMQQELAEQQQLAQRQQQVLERQERQQQRREQGLQDHSQQQQLQQQGRDAGGEHTRARPEDGGGAVQEPQQKRARVQEGGGEGRSVRFQDTGSQQTVPAAEASAQVSMALSKLIAHLGNPSKFQKAAGLFRQLLEGESLTKEHRPLVFEALRAAFPIQAERTKHIVDPAMRRDVVKLLAAAHSRVTSGYFNKTERIQFTEIIHFIGGVRHEMQTDDTFIFSKVMAGLRKQVSNLPEATGEEEDAAYDRVMTDRITAHKEQDQAQQQQQQQQQAGPAPKKQPQAPKQADPDDPFGLDSLIQEDEKKKSSQKVEEDDPFSLNAFFEPQKPAPPKPKEPPSKTYDPEEMLAARRRVLLDCVQHARTFHKLAWAQTAIELTAEHCWQNKSRFCTQQHEEVEELWRWVRNARALRKRGPSAKEINRDSTSFERASDTWSRINVSHRGKVGAQGDAKSVQWLG